MEEDVGRRAQIVRAAFEEFAAHGFAGATIKGIARAARLQSQALIYWYFPTKEALFQAVIEAHIPFLQDLAAAGPLLDRPPEEVLPLLARGYLATAHLPVAQGLLRILIPEVLRRPELAALIGSLLRDRVLAFLTVYMDRQIALGRFRSHDTRSSARAFFGMLIPQAAGVVALPALLVDGPTDDQHVATAVEIFLRGVRA